jgi:20S proteasome subunit alpha 4
MQVNVKKYTQSGGRRPFGISTLIMGFDSDKVPKLYQTDPSGIYSAWKANAIGRSSKTVREFLEKHFVDNMSNQDTIKLAVKSLLEVVQSGAKNIDIAYMGGDAKIVFLASEEIERIAAEIEKEKEAEAEKNKKKSTSAL